MYIHAGIKMYKINLIVKKKNKIDYVKEVFERYWKKNVNG